MSVYFEYPAQLASSEGSSTSNIVCTAFSHGDQAVCAIGTADGHVQFFLEEGDRVEHIDSATNTSVPLDLQRNGSATTLAWHPRLHILATGWDDGTIALWSEKDKNSLREETLAHKASITLLQFSPEGTRLISGDSAGVLVVWNIDHRGKLTQLHSYTKKGTITQLVFRAPATLAPSLDGSPTPCPSFFFAGSAGLVYFGDDLGHCAEVIKIGNASVASLFYSHSRDSLVIISNDVTLFKYHISPEGKMTEEKKVKLSIKGDGSDFKAISAGSGLIAGSNNEQCIRFYHAENDSTYILPLSDPRLALPPKEIATCVSFNPKKRILAAATMTGRVCFWKFVGRSDASGSDPSDADWEPLPALDTKVGYITKIQWDTFTHSSHVGLLSIASKERLSLLSETILQAKYSDGNMVTQLSADALSVQVKDGRPIRVNTSIRIKGMDLSSKYILIWNGKRCELFSLPNNSASSADLKLVSAFNSRASCCVLKDDSIYAAVAGKIEVLSLQGVVKSQLNMNESEGAPITLDVNGDFLACATSHGYLKIWDISRREPKAILPGRSFEADFPGLMPRSLRLNNVGSKVSIVALRSDEQALGSGVFQTESRIFVYDVETDKLQSFDFGPRYYPVLHVWDATEHKLLCVETKKFEVQPKEEEKEKKEDKKSMKRDEEDDDFAAHANHNANANALNVNQLSSGEVTTLFVTSEFDILMQDSFIVNMAQENLVGMNVPHILFVSSGNLMSDNPDFEADNLGLPRLKTRVMRDFVGLENITEENRRDLLNFSYFLTIGNMDEAYKSVKKISSESIWENMAHMCVKTKRLDVAEICLGHMNNAVGAKAVRESKKEKEKEAQVAMLAIHLKLPEEAERLYTECKRWDLLTQFYMSSGRWRDAIKTCQKYDRIHLKTTYFLYARYLESTGDFINATKMFEKAGSHKTEVPRMLFDNQRIKDLESYIKSSNEPALFKWWAQYCESNASYDEALKYYDLAKETLAQTRVLCFMQREHVAEDLVIEKNEPAACYHLAHHYELNGKIPDAIRFYKAAKRYNHAIRLAKENFDSSEGALENELMQLALECASKDLKVDVARFFEERGLSEKAVILYQKGGKIPRALEMCFKAQLFDSLRIISDSLGAETDPALLSKCGDFFMQHDQFEKAAHLYITAKEYIKALSICMKYNVKISETMAEKMTPPKGKTEQEKKEREDILRKLAHCCKDQGSYHLACKKYTQANEHVKAMKCLLKSSDTEKIVYYATMTKQPEIYILAANYLQNLDWHSDAEVMKNIINFYTKAKALVQLANFYDACAQVEIDEYRDYEKALGALQESLKYLIKSKNTGDKEDKIGQLDTRVKLVSRFVEARKLVKTNPNDMINLCHSLLAEEVVNGVNVESAIRVGDVFALLIEYYYSIGQYGPAYKTIEQMRQRGIILSPYLDQAMVQQIHQAVGVQMQDENGAQPQQQHQQQNDEHDIGEEINEEM